MYLITMLISVIQGISHEILYSRLGSFWAKWNEHVVFNIERLLWGVLTLSAVNYGLNNEYSIEILPKLICYSIGAFLSFSFFHNGGYGIATAYRHNTGILNGWAYSSKSDTARNSFDFMTRFWLFILGFTFVIIGSFLIK